MHDYSFYSGRYREVSCGSFEPPFHEEFPEKSALTIKVSGTIFKSNPLCKFEPHNKKSCIRPCFYYLFYFIYMGQPIWDPYETRLHCQLMGAHMGPM